MMKGVVVVVLLLLSFSLGVEGVLRWTGVNAASLEGGNVPGRLYFDYTPPLNRTIGHFAALGMNIFRLPFRWERVQRTLFGPLSDPDINVITGSVNFITGNSSSYVLLDPHNYGSYYGNDIGDNATSLAAFTDFWSRLATVYKDNPKVLFGLMNEPTIGTLKWLAAANAGIAGIRQAGATNTIFIPGNFYSGSWSWASTNTYGPVSNAQAMGNVSDPLNNFVFEVHQYFDSDYSGTHDECQIFTNISRRLFADFTSWCRQRGYKGFLGEFGGPPTNNCLTAIAQTLEYFNQNTDVWVGYSIWTSGPFYANYFQTVEPKYVNGTFIDTPHIAVMQRAGFAGNVSPSPSPSPNTNAGSSSTDTSSTPGGSASTIRNWLQLF